MQKRFLQIRKNLGPTGDKPRDQGNKKTIQIVFRNKNNQQKSIPEEKESKNQLLNFSLKWHILTFAPLSDKKHRIIKFIVFLSKTFKNTFFRKYFPDHLLYTAFYADSHGDIHFCDLWLIRPHFF